MSTPWTPVVEYGRLARRRGEVSAARYLASLGLLAACAPVSATLPEAARMREPSSHSDAPAAVRDDQPSARASPPAQAKVQTAAADEAAEPGADGVSFHDLGMKARAKAVRVGDGWGLEVTLTVTSTGDRTFRLESLPAPHLMGSSEQPSGSQAMEFSDGCWANLQEPLDAELAPGESRSFTRRWVPIVPISSDETLRLRVGLCRIGLPGGAWEDHHGPTVTLRVDSGGRPRLHIDNPPKSGG